MGPLQARLVKTQALAQSFWIYRYYCFLVLACIFLMFVFLMDFAHALIIYATRMSYATPTNYIAHACKKSVSVASQCDD